MSFQVGYEAGSSGNRLPAACMNDLDMELIPVIHRAAANITDQPIILELVFHIMEQWCPPKHFLLTRKEICTKISNVKYLLQP